MITTPLNGATTSGPITVVGTATDNIAIGNVGVAIYQASSGQYWNGTNFQTGFRTVNATLSNPGDPNTGWTYTFTPPAPGFYLIGALPIDGKFNFSLTTFNTINHS